MPLASNFALLKIEEGIDSEEEKVQVSNTKPTKTKKNKKKAASARKDISKLLEKLNTTSEKDDLNVIAQSIENNNKDLNINSNFEDEIQIAIMHSKELEKAKNNEKNHENSINAKFDNRKHKTKNIITMSLGEFTSGDAPIPVHKIVNHFEKILPQDNEDELAKKGFFTSAKAEKQYKTNLEERMRDEISKKKKQSESELKIAEKQKKLLDSKGKKISQLTDLENKLLEEVTQVKKRNHQLNFMIKTPEMESKLKLIKDLEELNQFIKDMEIEISERRNEIQVEITTNNELRSQIDKLKDHKSSNK